jgi:hypothetical protein
LNPNLLAGLNRVKDLLRADQPMEAEKECRSVLALAPGHLETRLLLAHCWMLMGQLDQAQDELKQALEEEPGNQTIRNLLGEVHLRQGNWVEIRRELERRLEPFSGPETDYERACIKLRFADMPQGWLEYESRWKIPEFMQVEQHYSQPRWQGESFEGRTLLLFWEQGFGDTLMFIRYAPLVKARGGKVLFAAQAQLADLIATCPGVDEVIAHGNPLPPFDLQCPLLSLPAIFQTNLDSVPAEIPYLDIPKRVPNRGKLALALAPSEGKTRVGLTWAGSVLFKNHGKRSIPAEALAPLRTLPEVAWFSFQVGRTDAPPFPEVLSLEHLLGNFSDTAYALSAMDLLITTDTAVAHLAGAMGVPTLLLLSALPDWRWHMGREDSPWYPSMRIYRQPSPGDWNGVVQQLLRDLSG